MDEKCKVGFWKWLLVKSPIAVLKGTRDVIVDASYGGLIVGGVLLSFTTAAVINFLGGLLVGGVVFLVAITMVLYGYYKKFVCERGDG